MRTRPLGSTGIEVGEIGFGAWAIGGPFAVGDRPIGWGRVDDKESLETLRHGFEAGINLVDTADIYGFGHSEEIVGQAIRESSRPVHVATKVGFLQSPRNGSIQDFGARHLRRACEASLRRLGRDSLDLYQLHCVPLDIIREGSVFGVLDRLKTEGKIRAYGVSIVTDEEALAAMEYPGVESIQIIFNVLRQKPLRTVLAKARTQNVGILARVPLASGLLTGKFNTSSRFSSQDHRSEPLPGETFSGVDFEQGLAVVEKLRPLASSLNISLAQMALSWILQSDAVTCAIPGARTTQQVRQNASSSGIRLDTQTIARIEEIYKTHVAPDVEALF